MEITAVTRRLPKVLPASRDDFVFQKAEISLQEEEGKDEPKIKKSGVKLS